MMLFDVNNYWQPPKWNKNGIQWIIAGDTYIGEKMNLANFELLLQLQQQFEIPTRIQKLLHPKVVLEIQKFEISQSRNEKVHRVIAEDSWAISWRALKVL